MKPVVVHNPSADMLLAIDPGTGTGVAWCDRDNPLETFDSGEIQGWLTFTEWFARATPSGPLHVVCESFTISQRTLKTHIVKDSLWIEGYVQAQCHRLGWPFEFQSPAQRMWATDEKLQALGWYKKTKDMHATDAARHLLTYLVSNKTSQHRELLRRMISP